MASIQSLTPSNCSEESAASSASSGSLWDRMSSSIRGDEEEANLLREQRRFAQFKKDEAVVMKHMNDELEREQKRLEARQAAQEKQKAQAKRVANAKRAKRNQTIHKFVNNTNNQHLLLPSSNPNKRGSSRRLLEAQEEEVEIELDCASTASLSEDEDRDGYQKTIRWCISVDVEQERRKVERKANPAHLGGVARRVRKLPKEEPQETPVQEECEEGVDMDALVSEYRELAGLQSRVSRRDVDDRSF